MIRLLPNQRLPLHFGVFMFNIKPLWDLMPHPLCMSLLSPPQWWRMREKAELRQCNLAPANFANVRRKFACEYSYKSEFGWRINRNGLLTTIGGSDVSYIINYPEVFLRLSTKTRFLCPCSGPVQELELLSPAGKCRMCLSSKDWCPVHECWCHHRFRRRQFTSCQTYGPLQHALLLLGWNWQSQRSTIATKKTPPHRPRTEAFVAARTVLPFTWPKSLCLHYFL